MPQPSNRRLATEAYVDTAKTTAQGTSLQKTANLSDVASAATARSNLGLGTAATQPSSAFDTAGAAAAVLPTQAGNSGKYLTTDGSNPSWGSVAASTLTPTATKTATYNAAVGDLAMMNVAGGATTLTLPTAPADRSQVGYRAIGASSAVPLTVNRGGATDTIGTAGATSASVPMADETVILQYDAPNTRWLAIANVRTQASIDARYAAKTTLPRFAGGSASRAQPNPTISTTGTNTGGNTRFRMTFPVAVQRFVVKYGNYENNAGVEIDGANPYTVRAAVEYPAGTFTPLFANGSRDITAAPGATVAFDPCTVAIPAATAFYVRTYATVTANTMSWPILGPLDSTQGDGVVASATPTDLTTSGTITLSNGFGLVPFSVQPMDLPAGLLALAVVGDSIAFGLQDSIGGRGWTGMAFDGQILFQKVPLSSEKATNWNDPNTRKRRWPLIVGCNVALCELGINDIGAGAETLAAFQANILTTWANLGNAGMKVFQTTLLPRTTSTDNWATAGNQAVMSYEAARTGFNDWLRDGAPVTSAANLTAVATGTAGALRAGGSGHPLTGYVEMADTVEVNASNALTRNGGRWLTNGRVVTDGAMSAASTTLTSATAAFVAGDVGRAIQVLGAGAAGATLTTTIASVTNSTTAVLAVAATTAVTAATVNIDGQGYTFDGTHPVAAGYTLIAAAATAAIPTFKTAAAV